MTFFGPFWVLNLLLSLSFSGVLVSLALIFNAYRKGDREIGFFIWLFALCGMVAIATMIFALNVILLSVTL